MATCAASKASTVASKHPLAARPSGRAVAIIVGSRDFQELANDGAMAFAGRGDERRVAGLGADVGPGAGCEQKPGDADVTGFGRQQECRPAFGIDCVDLGLLRQETLDHVDAAPPCGVHQGGATTHRLLRSDWRDWRETPGPAARPQLQLVSNPAARRRSTSWLRWTP